uniref:PH and SEC7 domain-containing protein 3 n=2 Tax=Timema TaxID=61471 RepID=A0A7R9EZQ8_9NEOP|nr:unnamed protein product [Timema bartmani]
MSHLRAVPRYTNLGGRYCCTQGTITNITITTIITTTLCLQVHVRWSWAIAIIIIIIITSLRLHHPEARPLQGLPPLGPTRGTAAAHNPQKEDTKYELLELTCRLAVTEQASGPSCVPVQGSYPGYVRTSRSEDHLQFQKDASLSAVDIDIDDDVTSSLNTLLDTRPDSGGSNTNHEKDRIVWTYNAPVSSPSPSCTSSSEDTSPQRSLSPQSPTSVSSSVMSSNSSSRKGPVLAGGDALVSLQPNGELSQSEAISNISSPDYQEEETLDILSARDLMEVSDPSDSDSTLLVSDRTPAAPTNNPTSTQRHTPTGNGGNIVSTHQENVEHRIVIQVKGPDKDTSLRAPSSPRASRRTQRTNTGLELTVTGVIGASRSPSSLSSGNVTPELVGYQELRESEDELTMLEDPSILGKAISPTMSEDESDIESLHSFHYSPKAVDIPSAIRLAKRLYMLDGFKKSDVSRHLSKKSRKVTVSEHNQLSFLTTSFTTINQSSVDVELQVCEGHLLGEAKSKSVVPREEHLMMVVHYSSNDFSRVVAEEYLKYFTFEADTLDIALRKFLKQFSLTGETQERERVLVHFSKRYLDCNPGTFNSQGESWGYTMVHIQLTQFNSQDAVHTLTCAIMLLNTDLHGQNLGRKMTCTEFIENLSELNDGENFPREVLKSLYQAIKSYPLEWALDEEGDECNSQLQGRQSGDNQQNLSGSNPFLDVPNAATAVEYKKGYVMRKCCVDTNGKKTPFGKRSWKMFYCTLRDLVLYLHKDEHGFRKSALSDNLHNAIRIHHALATKAQDYTKKQHVFRLQTADQSEYLFQTSDSKELQSWIDTINLVCASFSAQPLAGAVGSQRKFQRPLLPCSHTRLSLRDQLRDHEDRVQRLEAELDDHRRHPPDKNTKSLSIQNYKEKDAYLHYEHLISLRQVLSATETTRSANAVPFRLSPLTPPIPQRLVYSTTTPNFFKPILLAHVFALKRYKTYAYLLHSRVSQFPEVEVTSPVPEGDLENLGPGVMAPPIPDRRASPTTNRYSYRAAIYSGGTSRDNDLG